MALGKVIMGVVRSGRKAVGYLRKTVVYHDGRVVPLGQGRLNGAARAGANLVRSNSARSVKRDNAENQRARIAPGLDRHGVGWPGCRDWLAGIGWQDRLPAGRWIRLEMPKGRSSWAGRVPAMQQRCCPWGELRFGRQPRATGACSG